MRRRPLLRAAIPRDAAAIASLLGLLGYPARAGEVRDALSRTFVDPRHAVVLAEAERVVVGLLVLAGRPSLSRGGWVGVLEALAVRTDCRRRGVGEAETFCWGALESRHPRVPAGAARTAATAF